MSLFRGVGGQLVTFRNARTWAKLGLSLNWLFGPDHVVCLMTLFGSSDYSPLAWDCCLLAVFSTESLCPERSGSSCCSGHLSAAFTVSSVMLRNGRGRGLELQIGNQ